jgi:hypothetical protein
MYKKTKGGEATGAAIFDSLYSSHHLPPDILSLGASTISISLVAVDGDRSILDRVAARVA